MAVLMLMVAGKSMVYLEQMQQRDLTQDVVLFQLPAKGSVDHWRIVPVAACTGSTTAVTGLGTATNNVFYRLSTFDIQAAPGDTNFDGNISATGSTNLAAVNVVASLTNTVDNIDQLVTGCAVDYKLEWSVLAIAIKI